MKDLRETLKEKAGKMPGQKNKVRFSLWFLLLAVWAIILGQGLLHQAFGIEELAYSEFLARVDAGEIEVVAITPDRIQGELKGESDGQAQRFTTVRVEEELTDRLRAQGVQVTGVIQSTIVRDLISWILPALLFVGLWLFILRRMGSRGGVGGMMAIGKSKAKVYMEENLKTTFQDVAGVEEAEEELQEIVSFLKDPQRYSRLGGRMPKGVLLVGPPGTGKTLLARAVAGEAGVRFFYINGSEFVEMFVGVGAARVRDLFEQAREHSPCIIFIDELDALGKARGLGFHGGGNDEKEQTLNQLLVELDGFDPSRGVVLMAASNRPEVLDPALLRAGRFDRQILVDRPGLEGRIEILKIHVKEVTMAPEAGLDVIASMTPGFTGADLANLVNEAALLATRKDKSAVELEDLTEAYERIVVGLAKRRKLLDPKKLRIVAYHEMGHALAGLALAEDRTKSVHKVSIIPHGISALGYTLNRPSDDLQLRTRPELESEMVGMFGGRAAEELIFGDVSTGAANDLQQATNVARNMVLRLGMGEKTGLAAMEAERFTFLGGPEMAGQRDYSEETAREIDCEVRAILDRAYARAQEILTAHRSALETGAELLLERESLSGEEITRIFEEDETTR